MADENVHLVVEADVTNYENVYITALYFLGMKINEVMHKPAFISARDSLENAARVMSENNVSGLLVGTAKKLEGVVTKEDLVKHFGHKELVSEIMTVSGSVLSPQDDTNKALSFFKKNTRSVVPISENGIIVGVLSSKDLLEESRDEEEEFLFG